MATRIQVEWSDLIKMARQIHMKTLAEKKGPGSRGAYSQVNQVWESVVRLLIAIVEYVRIDDVIFDEILELLENLISIREDVRNALSAINGDSVWLVTQRQGKHHNRDTPTVAGYQFLALESIAT